MLRIVWNLMAVAVFTETQDNTQYSTQLKPKSRRYTQNSSSKNLKQVYYQLFSMYH